MRQSEISVGGRRANLGRLLSALGSTIPIACALYPVTAPAARWTAMIYMDGDNGMSDQTYVDIAEMAQVGSTPEVNIVVQVDRAASDSLPLPRLLRIEQGQARLLAGLPELDMADPATLADFVRFCRDHYPADNYLLVLWDHGDGWTLNSSPPPNPRPLVPLYKSVLYDQSSGRSMSVARGDLRTALTGVRTALGRKVPLLAFDACLMQMLEVVYEVKDAAEICVGTEDLMPFNGFPYKEFLGRVVAEPALSPREYASALPGLFAGAYNGGSQGTEDVTLSALDLAPIPSGVSALTELLGVNSAYAAQADFRAARRTAQTFSCEHVPPLPTDDNIDLLDFLDKTPWRKRPGSKQPDPAASFERAVIAHASNGPTLANARGIAVWFPDNYLAFKHNYELYDQLTFAQDCPWLHFLNCFFSSDDIKPTAVAAIELLPNRVGRDNDYWLHWSGSRDLSPVSYELREATGVDTAFNDHAENLDLWFNEGFILSADQSHSGSSSFYSGSGDDLDHKITAQPPLSIPEGGILSFFAQSNTSEFIDPLGNFRRDICYVEGTTDPAGWTVLDSLYGYAGNWQEHRYFLPAADHYWLRFRFHTGNWSHLGGIYLDDIKVNSLRGNRLVTPDCRDTSFRIFDALKDTYFYAVAPRDSFGNVGPVSPLLWPGVAVTKYAQPFTLPNPITGTGPVTIVCDFPPGETTDVLVYNLSGELVCQIPQVSTPRVSWDTRNSKGKLLGSGIYLVVVQGAGSRSLGRIAIAR